MGQPKIRVAVVFGGRSTEHAVSCASAGLILSAIDPDRYEVLPIGIATDGRWVLTSGDPARLALSSGSVPSVESVAVGDGEIVSRGGPSGSALQVLSPGSVPRDLGSVDVVLMSMSYHDLYFKDEGFSVDPAMLFKEVHAMLKKGGELAIIDHAANAGTGSSSAQELHRIDEAFARKDIESRGFKFVGSLDVLHNPADDHTKAVFDEAAAVFQPNAVREVEKSGPCAAV